MKSLMQVTDLNINKSQQACFYTEKSRYNTAFHLSRDWQETPGHSLSQWEMSYSNPEQYFPIPSGSKTAV